MISLQQQQQQQQQKSTDLLIPCNNSWKFDREELAPFSNSSLSCALEKSMKVWQPTTSEASWDGHVGKNCLGNALKMTWVDWTKVNQTTQVLAARGSDDLSVSSSGSSRGDLGSGGSGGPSRTPSPFSYPVSSSSLSAAASNHPLPATLPSALPASLASVNHPLSLLSQGQPPRSQHHGNGFGLGTAAAAASLAANGASLGASGPGLGATNMGATAVMQDISMRLPSPGGQEVMRQGAGAAAVTAAVGAGPTLQNEVYSRKVFVGGLPPDIDQDEIKEHFIRFGPLTVDWPHKAQSKAYFPPKGYAFLLFRDEVAVHRLVKVCVPEDGKLFMFVSSVTQTHKKVQIRPWKLSDSDFIMDHTQPIDPRKTIFIGGVPRPLKAAELADIFNSRYGNVCYAGIDCDPELKYPKGAGRVTFSSRVSFMSAVSCRFLQVTYGDIDKKVEVKPYVLDDQVCDECQGLHCGGRYAPYFCGNIHCLRYYCEHCWAAIHSAPGTQNHRCFIKENGDRPRAINFFPSQSRVPLP